MAYAVVASYVCLDEGNLDVRVSRYGFDVRFELVPDVLFGAVVMKGEMVSAFFGESDRSGFAD
jgi:hypothetical protein